MPIALTCRKFDNDSFLQSLKSRLIDRPLRSDTPNARKSPTYLLQIQLTDADQNFSWSSDGIVALQAVLPIFGCPAEPAPTELIRIQAQLAAPLPAISHVLPARFRLRFNLMLLHRHLPSVLYLLRIFSQN